jgi:lipase chaperone LimK
MAMTLKKSAFWLAVAVAAVSLTVIALTESDKKAAVPIRVEPTLFPFVRSLQGTYPDGKITADDADALVVDAELRRLFDYYLASIGEKSLDQIHAEIERELEQRLKPRAASEAKRLLVCYLDYKRALIEVEKNPQAAGNAIGALRTRFNEMQQVRSQFFSAAESEALFGFDDAYDRDALARLEISQDATLDERQKQEKLAALDAGLPAAIREAKDAPLQIVKLDQAARKMRAEGGSDDDVYRLRAAALSPEAAARLADVDQDEAVWKNRIAGYLAERNALLQATTNRPQPDRQALLQELRQARFSADEQRRLGAYE